MPKLKIPSKPKQWAVSYLSDYSGDIIKSMNVSFDTPFGAPNLSAPVIPHTVTQDVAAIGVPTKFLRANLAGTDAYWAVAEKLYTVSLVNYGTTHFAGDAISGSPTGLTDGEMVKFGKTVGTHPGRDIVVVSDTGTNLSIYNNDDDFNAPTWRNDWWTGKTATMTSASITNPQEITTSAAHGYSTGDIVLISGTTSTALNISSSTNTNPISITTSANHGFQTGDTVVITGHTVNTSANGTWTVTSTGVNTFTIPVAGVGVGGATGTATELDDQLSRGPLTITVTGASTFTILDVNGSGAPHGPATGGTISRIFDDTNQLSALGQPALTSGVPHVLLTFGNAPTLFILDGSYLHSVSSPPGRSVTSNSVGAYTDYSSVTYERLVFKKGYVGNWMAATPYKIYIGLKNSLDDSAPSLVEEYDPFSEQVREFTIDEGSTVGWVQGDVVRIVDRIGQVKAFNGSGFDVYSNFPSAYDYDVINIHRNGMLAFGKHTLFLVQSNAPTFFNGIWMYSPDSKNLYHRAGIMVYHTNQKTFGSPYVTTPGALGYLTGYPSFFAGVATYETSTSLTSGIFVSTSISLDGAGDARGFVITSKIPADDIDSVWRNFLVKYNMNYPRFGTQNSSILVKYRVADPTYSVGINVGTWTSSTTFTATLAVNAAVGDEITILAGNGAGATAHITNKVGLNITIDEAPIASPTGGFYFIAENWQKISPTITQSTLYQSYLFDIPTAIQEWVQFKVELREASSVGPIIEEFQLGYEPNLKVEK